MRIVHVVGARPNFIKIAPVVRAFRGANGVDQLIVHTGQHYDSALSEDFFHDLELPKPDINLSIGSGSHADQTARVMMGLEPVLQRSEPEWLFTVGSANSTLAAALVAAKIGIPVAHIEAGLRSHDRAMPEEINRLLTDQLSDALFTTEPSANENLRREGIDGDRIHYVGNVMIDSLDQYRAQASQLDVDEALGLEPGRYVLVTLHRPENVDSRDRLSQVLVALGQIASYYPVVFPLHPRTAHNVKRFGLEADLAPITVLGPTRYLEFLALLDRAGAVITDSGGIQEETSVLGIPCLTLRTSTERPITVTEGTSVLVDGELNGLVELAVEAVDSERRPFRPELWDGRAAERIARITVERLADIAPRGRRPAEAIGSAIG